MSFNTPNGYKTIEDLPEFTRVALLNMLAKGSLVTILDAEGEVTPLGMNVLVDVSWEDTHGSGKNQKTVTLYRTLCFMHRPEFKLPKFEMNHAEGLLGKIVHKGGGTTEMPKLDFPDRAELHKRYTITSPVPDSCRLVFTPEVLDALDQHDGMDGIANHNGVMTWRDDDRLLHGEARSRLVMDTKAIFGSILDDPAAGHRIADAVEGTYADELVARLEADGSKTALQMLANMIRREQVDDLITSAVPRVPPAPITKRTLGSNTGVIIAGFLMSGIGLPLSITGLILNPMFQRVEWWISLAILGVGIIGVFMVILGIRWRRRTMRILVHGQWIQCRIVSVDATDDIKNDEILHEIGFQGIGRDDVNVKISLGTDSSRIARQIMYNNEETRILIDPDEPDRGLWLEGWVVENVPD